MRQRLRIAAEEGILLGVKYGLALVIILSITAWGLGDYQQTRVGARQGAAAYQEVLRQAQARQPDTKP